MKRYYFILFLLLISDNLFSQSVNPLFRHWRLDANGSFQIFGQQQLIEFSKYEPQNPCRIDSIYFHFYSFTGGTADIVFNVWENSGGYNGPYLLKQLTDSIVVTISIPARQQQGYTWKFTPPLLLPARPFCVGIHNRALDSPIALGWSTLSQIPPCSADTNSFFTSAYGYWRLISQNPPIQTLIMSGFFYKDSLKPNVRMGDYLINVFGAYINVVGPTQKTFKDVTALAGLSSASGRGISWGDYDNNGYQDLLMQNKLYRNKGNGTFEDVSAITKYDGGSSVNLFVDVDNNGELDILCQPVDKLFVNDKGVFQKSIDFGFEKSNSTTTVTAADYNNDKYPDVFVGNWERWDLIAKNPANPNDSTNILSIGYKSHLYKNEKNNFFTETTDKLLGYQVEQLSSNPYTQAPVSGYRVVYGSGWCDYDNDGNQDLFVGCYRFQPNYLFTNQGDGSFIDDAESTTLQGHTKSTNTFAHTIGSDWGDYNNDGNMDIIVSNFSHPDWRHVYGDMTALYKNSGPPFFMFEDQQPGAGIYYEETHSDVAWGDFNNDGLLDFYITATYSCRHGTLYMQDPNNPGTFIDVTYQTGTSTTTSWGVTWVDYDNDGDLDLAVTDGTGFHLFQNNTKSSANMWTELRLKSTSSNDFSIGARITVYAGGRKFTREVNAGKGSGSQNPYTVHIGFGPYVWKIDSIAVRWSPGKRQSWKNVPVNMILDVAEDGTLPTGVAQIEIPKSYELYQNFPNPFSASSSGNTTTTMTFDLPVQTNARVEIYNMVGGKVRTLANRVFDAGTHSLNWDGIDDNGNSLAGGTYMYILTAGETVLAKPMVYLK